MKLRTLIPSALAAVLMSALAHTSHAAPVAYTEEFVSDSQDWADGKTNTSSIPATFATWNASGGPSDSSYISVNMNTVSPTSAAGATRIVYRGGTVDPATISSPTVQHTSDDMFTGDWTANNLNHISFWVYDEAPVPLTYFARLASPGNFPGVIVNSNTTQVQPNTWTKVELVLAEGYSGQDMTVESGAGTLSSILSSVERFQIGFIVPASMAASSTSYKYGIDKIASFSGPVPEPSTVCLLVGASVLGLVRRRRAA